MNHPRSEKLVSKQTILQYSEEDLRGVVKAYPPPLGFLLPTFTMSHFLAISSPLLLPSTLERNLRRRPAVIYVKRVQSPCFTRQCFPLRDSAPCFRCSFTCWIAWNRNERCRRKKKMSCAYCLKGSISNNIGKTSPHFNNISLLMPLTKN